MNRHKLFKALRIAWSVAWGVVAVLLCVLWVRSYSHFDSSSEFAASSSRGRAFSWQGRIFLYENFHIAPSEKPFGMSTNFLGGMTVVGGIVEPAGAGLSFPYWSSTLAVAVMIATPWFRWRFSLRTLLIVTTLVALLLGLFAWLQ